MARPAIFHPAAIDAIRTFPEEIRRSLGKAIWELQNGTRLGMPLSKVISSVAAGVEEIRVRDANGTYRALYFARSPRGVLVFHAFEKRTQKMPDREINLARKRLRELLNEER